MRLEALMTTPVEVISPHASIRTAEQRLKLKGIHHLVVVDHGSVVGLVTSDTLRERGANGATRVEDAMIRNISMLSPETTVSEAAALMMPGHPQTAIPVVRNDRLVGIVTVADLLEMAGQLGEEAVPDPTRVTLRAERFGLTEPRRRRHRDTP
jgi:CBS domain-containing protein